MKHFIAIALIALSSSAAAQTKQPNVSQPPVQRPPFEIQLNCPEDVFITLRQGLLKLPAEQSKDLIDRLDQIYALQRQAYIDKWSQPQRVDSSHVKPPVEEKPKDNGKKKVGS